MAKRRRTIQWVVTGDKAIDRKLKKLGPKLGRKIARQAVRKVMKPILGDTIKFAPRDTSKLADGLKLRAHKARKRGSVVMQIRTDGPHGYLAVFHEFGTVKMPAKPFMRKAFDMHKNNARKQLLKEIWNGIRKELSK